ncbi:MAG: protein kinase domain-containing protein [Mycobacteriales bacterium]
MDQGTVIDGRYEIVREIGRGSMGVVWEARDTASGHRVAVKELQLPRGGDTAQLRERMLAEASFAAQLRHQNAAAVYTVLPDVPALVEEYVDGPSLLMHVRRNGPLPPQRAAAVGLQIARCLQAAHEIGLLHRDLKPGNVLLAPDGTVKVTDFGLAGVSTEQKVTLWGNVLGSPPYMSPEEARGLPASPASDWYGLGATLHYAVEGEPPFRGATAAATLTAVINQPLAPMQRAGAMEQVIAALLSKDPARRPPPDWLLRTLTEIAPPEGPVRPAGPATTPLWKRPVVVASALVALAAIGTGVALAASSGGKKKDNGQPTPPPVTTSAAKTQEPSHSPTPEKKPGKLPGSFTSSVAATAGGNSKTRHCLEASGKDVTLVRCGDGSAQRWHFVTVPITGGYTVVNDHVCLDDTGGGAAAGECTPSSHITWKVTPVAGNAGTRTVTISNRKTGKCLQATPVKGKAPTLALAACDDKAAQQWQVTLD